MSTASLLIAPDRDPTDGSLPLVAFASTPPSRLASPGLCIASAAGAAVSPGKCIHLEPAP
jgi:hypothetical protein